MSSKLASLKVKITANGAQATKELKSVEKKAKDVAKSMKKIGSTLTKYVTGPLVALAAVSVKTADTQMQAEAKLLNALKGREDVQKRLMAQASELQGRSLFGDEEIINQQAVLAAMGRTEQQINDIIEASAQLSAATGMSLDSAVKNLAKTYSGLAGELGESIPALRTLTKEQLQNGDAVKLIKEQYKGFAEAAAQTGAGPLVQLKNQLGDLSEQIGMILIPFVQELSKMLSQLVSWFQNLSPRVQEIIVKTGAFVAVLGPAFSLLGSLVGAMGNFVRIAPAVAAAVGTIAGPLAVLAGTLASIIALYQIFDRMREGEERKQWQTGYLRASAVSGGLSDDEVKAALAKVNSEYASLDHELRNGERLVLGRGDEIVERMYQLEGERDALTEILDKRTAINNATAEGNTLTQELQSMLGQNNPNAQVEAATGLIGQLQARVQALNKELANATTKEDIARINGELEETQKELARLQNLKPIAISQPMGLSADGLAQGFNKPKFKNSLSNTWKLWAQFNNNLEAEVERTVDLGKAFGEALGSAMSGMVTTIGETLGDLISMPAEGMENPLKGILTVLGNSLKSLGAALITYSGIVEAVKEVLSKLWTAGPGGIAAAIGIAIGAIAGGQALLNKAAKLPKLANGGLAYAPTLAMVGDNPGAASDPEVIAPLSKLRSYMGGQRLQLVGNVEFELHGDVARAVLNRENARILALG